MDASHPPKLVETAPPVVLLFNGSKVFQNGSDEELLLDLSVSVPHPLNPVWIEELPHMSQIILLDRMTEYETEID